MRVVGQVCELVEDELGLERVDGGTQLLCLKDVADDGDCAEGLDEEALGSGSYLRRVWPASSRSGTSLTPITPVAPGRKTRTRAPYANDEEGGPTERQASISPRIGSMMSQAWVIPIATPCATAAEIADCTGSDALMPSSMNSR